MRIAVAMSGGIDSTAAALKLSEQGHSIEGFTMLLYDNNDAAVENTVWKAKKVCKQIKVPHRVVDLRREFQKNVIEYFLKSYLSGSTPNPCIFCNPLIKFGALYEYAKKAGFEKFATGHYAVIEETKYGYVLKRGIDNAKDQSYFLSRIPRHIYPNLLFPLGKQTKKQTKDYLLKKGIHINSSESQEVCFIPYGDYAGYIKSLHPDIEKGDFIDEQGSVVGVHEGIPFYTIGQRRGLGISLGKPGYVRRIISHTNEIEIGDILYSDTFLVSDLIVFIPELMKKKLICKVRYRHDGVAARIKDFDENIYKAILDKPEKSVTPGQGAVFYKDNCVVASGIIQKIL